MSSNLINISIGRKLINDECNTINIFIDLTMSVLYCIFIDNLYEFNINMYKVSNIDKIKYNIVSSNSILSVDTLKRGNVRSMGLVDKNNNISIIRHTVKGSSEDLIIDEIHFKNIMKHIFKCKSDNKTGKIHVEYI